MELLRHDEDTRPPGRGRGRAADESDEKEDRVFRCRTCGAAVARWEDVFAMDAGGAVQAYVNPHGFLHEIVTLRDAQHLALASWSTQAASWFSGWAWRIAECATCHAHLGWRFEAGEVGCEPPVFFGLRRCQLADS